MVSSEVALASPSSSLTLDDAQLLRYSRHILLGSIGIEGQERIRSSHALIVGVGGLGSVASLYLAAAGVGTITLIDHDHVALSNLQRQIVHSTEAARTAQSKVASAKAAMQRLNPEPIIHALCSRADPKRLLPALSQADVVLDCTDNFATRHTLNALCVAHQKVLISGACVQMDGQISLYAPHLAPASPCYACVFPQDQTFEEVACANLGVLGPLVGVIGSLQAAEALKLLSTPKTVEAHPTPALLSRLLLLDGQQMRWQEIRTKRRDHCTVCG